MPYLFDENEYPAPDDATGYNGGHGMWRSTHGGFITARARADRRFGGDTVVWGTDRGLAAWKAFDAVAPSHLLGREERGKHYGVPAGAQDKDELVISIGEQGHRHKMVMMNWAQPNPWARPMLAASGPDGTVVSVVGEWSHRSMGKLLPKQWRTLLERDYVVAFVDSDTAAAIHLELGFELCARLVDVDRVAKNMIQHSRFPWSRAVLSTPLDMPYSERVLSGAYGFLSEPYGERGEDRASRSERGGLFSSISPSVYSSTLAEVAKRQGASEAFMDDGGSLAGRHARARHYHKVTAALKLAAVAALLDSCSCGRLAEQPEDGLSRLREFHDLSNSGLYRGHIECSQCIRGGPGSPGAARAASTTESADEE